MGYDCTFHLVDEKAIREEFVPKLLGRNLAPTLLDSIREDADELWSTVRRALTDGVDSDGDPIDEETVASLVCQLALIYSSCSLPHHYERGLAFSLWPDDQGLDEFPDEYAHSPEPLFAQVVEQYPKLRNNFPQWFTGNYSTGIYIPSNRVAIVRHWLEAQLQKLKKGPRRMFRSFVNILKSAEEKGFAYWEATDLAVPIMGQVPGDDTLMTADHLKNVPGVSPVEKFSLPQRLDQVGGGQDIHVLSSALPDTTLILDLRQWPPQCHVRDEEFTWRADRGNSGKWLFISRSGAKRGQITPARGRILADLHKDPEAIFDVSIDGSKIKVSDGFLINERVLLVPETDANEEGTDVFAWIQHGSEMRPAHGLPPHKVRKDSFSNARIVKDIARLADNAEVLLWEGDGYEWDGTCFNRTFHLGVTEAYDPLCAVALGNDGFFFLKNRQLFEIHRGKEPEPHLPDLTNIMQALPGPAGGILLMEGENDDGDIGKLYFPANCTFIHIEPELLGDQDLYDFLCWSRTANRIIASDRMHLYAISADKVLSLPRYDALTKREVVGGRS